MVGNCALRYSYCDIFNVVFCFINWLFYSVPCKEIIHFNPKLFKALNSHDSGNGGDEYSYTRTASRGTE